MRVQQHERGFALIGAVFALVVIATLVAGAFFASTQEVSIGRSTQTFQRAFDAAVGGMATRVASWPALSGTLNALAVDAERTFTDTMPDGRSTATSIVRRLNNELFLIRTTGGNGSSERMLGAIAKLQRLQMDIKASLTTRSRLKIGGSSFIDGRNTNPTGWGCDAATDTLAGLRTPDSTQIEYSGCSGCVFGTPDIMQDTTVKDSTFFSFGGGLGYADLVAMATNIYTGNTGPLNDVRPVGDASTCTIATKNNWGEPWRSAGYIAGCIDYFPIIHVTGNLKLTGGRGQGILLIDGDLSVQGGFEFYGPVVVKGHFETQGTGGHFNGGVLAADVDLELNTVLGSAVITYSGCSILRAITASANARLLRERRWMDLTQ